jgi:hypothetical protein
MVWSQPVAAWLGVASGDPHGVIILWDLPAAR